MRTALLVTGVPLALAALGGLGLSVTPAPLPAFSGEGQAPATIPLPAGLPAPVERFYRALYGERVPVITSAVITGRGRLRLPSSGGVTFPARFRFTHVAGQAYRHYIEATFFGLPLMKVNEHYINGRAWLELPPPLGVAEGSKIDQGANLALWAESIWLPSVWITDERVRWEPVDGVTAQLLAPFGNQVEHFVVRFDPDSGLPRLMESMRYKGESDVTKTLWINESPVWGMVDGHPVPTSAAVTWFDERTPWGSFNVEEVVYNADVREYIRASGA